MTDCFIDTNVFLYAAAVQEAQKDMGKREVARDLLKQNNFGMSAQIMQEFYTNALRLHPVPLPKNEALKWLEMMASMDFVPTNQQLVFEGIAFADRYQLSYWDGAVLAAANALNAQTLFSEDLNDGQIYGAVKVVNPFKELAN